MTFPPEIIFPSRNVPGVMRVKVAALCACLDHGSFDGVALTESETAPFFQEAKSELNRQMYSVWVRTHAFINIEPAGTLARFMNKVLTAASDSISRGQLRPVSCRVSLDGQIDPRETWILMDDFQDWCEARGLRLGDCWNEYCDDEEKIFDAALSAADEQRRQLEALHLAQDLQEKVAAREAGISEDSTEEYLRVVRENIALRAASIAGGGHERPLSPKERTTYRNIVGGLLTLFLTPGPNGKSRSGYLDQSAVIDALLAHFPNVQGLSERNLQKYFADGKRAVAVG